MSIISKFVHTSLNQRRNRTKTTTVWFCLAAALGGLALTPVAANAREYQLQVKHSQKCLDVAWSSMVDGGNIVQSSCTANPIATNQSWEIHQPLGGNWVMLEAKHSHKYMDVQNSSTTHAADVVQWEYGSSPATMSQVWDFVHHHYEDGVEWFTIRNVHSNLCLDVAYFSGMDGGNVLQANCTGTDNQLWRAQINYTPTCP